MGLSMRGTRRTNMQKQPKPVVRRADGEGRGDRGFLTSIDQRVNTRKMVIAQGPPEKSELARLVTSSIMFGRIEVRSQRDDCLAGRCRGSGGILFS